MVIKHGRFGGLRGMYRLYRECKNTKPIVKTIDVHVLNAVKISW